MKKSIGVVLLVGALLASPLIANADEYYNWPDYGTFASHNNWATKYVGADQALSQGATGVGVKVAVLDSGVTPNTPGVSNKIIAYKDFVQSQPPLQEHGTLTASTVVADYDPIAGFSGIAPGVSLIIGRVRYLSYCDNSAIRSAFAWAVSQGAQIISMSFGGNGDAIMQEEIISATQKGILVVGAAGNNGCLPNASWGLNRSCILGITTESSQASYPIPGLMEIGASDERGGRASFSSWGPNLDLMAPGVNTSAYDPAGATNGFGGTSAATPIVAGVAALVLSVAPQLTGAEVQAILQATTSPAYEVKPQVWDSCVKSSVDNTWSCNALVSSDFPQQYFTGAGVVSANKAIQLAKLIASGQAIAAPTISQSNLSVSVTWLGGAADLYMNSKKVASSVESGYQITGFESESASIQIRRGSLISKPTLISFRTVIEPPAPTVESLWTVKDDLYFRVTGFSAMQESLGFFGNYYYGAVFRLVTGEEIFCAAPYSVYSDSITFDCPIVNMPTTLTGNISLLGKGSVYGAASALMSTTRIIPLAELQVNTTYVETGLVRFQWLPVDGAQSYSYRYAGADFLCTTETQMDVSDISPSPVGWFFVAAYSNDDCTGNKLNESGDLPFTPIPPIPAKPTGITVKEVTPTSIEFQTPAEPFTGYWRIYRSDGLMIRANFDQSIRVGMQANEDVNGIQFSFRFVLVRTSKWIGFESWSPPSDPIIASFQEVAAPTVYCRQGRNRIIGCTVRSTGWSEGTYFEYLDADMNVISSSLQKTNTQMFVKSQSGLVGAKYVRISSIFGEAGRIDRWFRRGQSDTQEILSTVRSNVSRAI